MVFFAFRSPVLRGTRRLIYSLRWFVGFVVKEAYAAAANAVPQPSNLYCSRQNLPILRTCWQTERGSTCRRLACKDGFVFSVTHRFSVYPGDGRLIINELQNETLVVEAAQAGRTHEGFLFNPPRWRRCVSRPPPLTLACPMQPLPRFRRPASNHSLAEAMASAKLARVCYRSACHVGPVNCFWQSPGTLDRVGCTPP